MSLTGSIKGEILQGNINRLHELRGYSAYEIAVMNGFYGTQEEWLASLRGDKGDPGEVIHTDADGDVLEDVFVTKSPVYKATPSTLAEVIRSADPGATIQLEAGTYPCLDLVGVNAYPEGLTIVGCEDAFVAGISITSGLIDPTYITGDNPNMEMPSNLTLKGISLTDSICLRNCAVDGLNILNCRFHAGNILLAPDSLIDQYGRDTTDTEKTVMWHHDSVKPRIRNVIIDGNVFARASTNNIIEVNCVDNVEITNNDIREAGYNGIHVNGQSGSYSTGRIAILKNEIRSSVSRSIRIAALKDAELFVHSNGLCNANTNGKSSDYIKVSDCKNTTFTWTLGTGGYNTYRENKDAPHRNLVVGEDISLENCTSSYVESDKHPGCYYRTVDGVTEWINPPMELGVEYRTTERYDGKTVYTQLVNLGKFFSKGAIFLPLYHNGSIRKSAWADGYLLPFYYEGTLIADISVEPSGMGICLMAYHENDILGLFSSSSIVRVQLWYVKDVFHYGM